MSDTVKVLMRAEYTPFGRIRTVSVKPYDLASAKEQDMHEVWEISDKIILDHETKYPGWFYLPFLVCCQDTEEWHDTLKTGNIRSYTASFKQCWRSMIYYSVSGLR